MNVFSAFDAAALAAVALATTALPEAARRILLRFPTRERY